MLVLSRKIGESVVAGPVTITILNIQPGRVKIGCGAEPTVPILRGELLPQHEIDNLDTVDQLQRDMLDCTIR